MIRRTKIVVSVLKKSFLVRHSKKILHVMLRNELVIHIGFIHLVEEFCTITPDLTECCIVPQEDKILAASRRPSIASYASLAQAVTESLSRPSSAIQRTVSQQSSIQGDTAVPPPSAPQSRESCSVLFFMLHTSDSVFLTQLLMRNIPYSLNHLQLVQA